MMKSILIAFALALALARSTVAAEPFPLQPTVAGARINLREAKIKDTGLNKGDYLKVISGIVNYFHHFQAADGRIIDPFLHREFQYSTPCYAWAAAALVASNHQPELVDSAASALDSALHELAENKPADNHGDFFTFPCMLAYENLRDRVPITRRQYWEALLRSIDPSHAYRDLLSNRRDQVHNWNVVAVSGEFLRYQNGFTDLSFVEKYLEDQQQNFTSTGQYRDPNLPMAYDHFPRHFLAVVLERGYKGKYRAELEDLMNRAAWTSLLMQSPRGELPTGGRSAQHQWNEAEQCVTYEIWAMRSERADDAAAAQAFKRAAHLSLQSIQQWVRPSGELWIVKNRFDPSVRHGFQSYSSHSQYNLLAASMLATAWKFSDDAIPESACPADAGGFAFALPEFHKVFANAGGLYLEIDTAADPEYNSTGLIRIHKSGVDSMLGPTDSAPAREGALALGVGWRIKGEWRSLAEFTHDKIQAAKLSPVTVEAAHVQFDVRYEIATNSVKAVVEHYDLTSTTLHVRVDVDGPVDEVKARFPILAFDGERAPEIVLKGNEGRIRLNGSEERLFVVSSGTTLTRSGKWISCRNGFLEAIEGAVNGKSIEYVVNFSPGAH